ncbi:hypothetical protein SeMB42_g05583 [Synchytrium endobioticum]|uniref:Letm1 RBD domain-containing protein n=1 Tax=Synchytrium endobioticum TaxID=286115 RepID=A0A507CQL0_9FUNG|nr:hypothetical protein SeMB42_g05583 [Synchytrium endobioticum]TPX47020.1 hypothetical protein SeLEV6574_g02873 [Synchytrium endobioticum]
MRPLATIPAQAKRHAPKLIYHRTAWHSSRTSAKLQMGMRSTATSMSSKHNQATSESLASAALDRHFSRPLNELMEGLAQLVSMTKTACAIYWSHKAVRDRFDVALLQQTKRDLLAILPGLFIFLMPSTRLKVAVIRRASFLYPLVFVTPRLHDLVIQDATKYRQAKSKTVLALLLDMSARSVGSSSGPLSQRLYALTKKALQQYSNSSIVIPYTHLQPLLEHFRTHLSLLKMTESELAVLTKYLNFITRPRIPYRTIDEGIRLFVPLPKLERLIQWADWIVKDDYLIRQVGVKALNDFEVVLALYERGFVHLTEPISTLRNSLNAWLKFTDFALQYLVKRRVGASGKRVTRDEAIDPEDLAVLTAVMLAGQSIVTSNVYTKGGGNEAY